MPLTARAHLAWCLFLATGVGVRVAVFVRYVLPFEVTVGRVMGTGLTLMPYVALASLHQLIPSRVVTVLTGLAVVGTDLHAVAGVMRGGGSSTAVVALGLQPLFALIVIVPSGLLLGLLVDRLGRWWR